jgi:hypothetical protein
MANGSAFSRFLALLLLCAVAAFARPVTAAEPLPALGADEARLSVSGLSSGAYMAGQFQVAYSSIVIGAGLVAGGPYGCAYTPGVAYVPFFWVLGMNLNRALRRCMDDGGLFSGVPGVGGLADHARRLADRGRIDDLAGLKSDKVYIFSSTEDETVETPVVERAQELYRALGVPDANIAFVKHDKAAHAFITESGGERCGVAGEPFINDCDYDQAKAILETIYGGLAGPGSVDDGRYTVFDQTAFADGPVGGGMDEEGVVYVPQPCASERGCAVHVVFHGCKQGRERLGDGFIKASGFDRWAAANRIILLFPQVASSTANPNGCWDWWGYTGSRFLERDAPQMKAVRGMVARLAERR